VAGVQAGDAPARGKEYAVAEIRVERKQHSMMPWILGLVLLGLAILALAFMMGYDDGRQRALDGDAAAAESTWDTPPHLRQYASVRGTGLATAA
jgi:hypothetical protein